MPAGTAVSVVWFKRDLRTKDHRALAKAAVSGPVLPLFIAEPDLWHQPDMSARHWAFVRDSLAELRETLAGLGQPLVVLVGHATQVLDELRQSLGIKSLWSHEETGNAWTYRRDRAVAAWCRAHGIPWRQERQTGVIRGLSSRDGWARRWDRFMAETTVAAPPALEPIDGMDPGALPAAEDLGVRADPCPDRQAGGRAAGQERLQSFLDHRGEPYRTAMSGPETGYEHCSRLSPHLAWGTLSMR